MADSQLHTLLAGGAFFESPRWHDGRWWVSDFYGHLVLSVSATGEPREVLEVEEQPSGLGWMPDGSMLVVSMRDHRILRRPVTLVGYVPAVDRAPYAHAGYVGTTPPNQLFEPERPDERPALKLAARTPARCGSRDSGSRSDRERAIGRACWRRSSSSPRRASRIHPRRPVSLLTVRFRSSTAMLVW